MLNIKKLFLIELYIKFLRLYYQKKQSFILSYINVTTVLDPESVNLKSLLDNKHNLTAMIKVNGKLFNFVTMVNIYIKIFMFREKML